MEHYNGLTTHEALTLLKSHGPNKIASAKSFNFAANLFGQVFSFLNSLLLLAALVALVLGATLDTILIVLIVILNSAISFWQEYKADRTLAELKKITHSYVRTVRDNKEAMIDSELLVPGDLILLEVGDKVPADGQIIESVNFEINESSLTGESVAVYKKAGEAEHNQIYSGTIVAGGRGKIKIFATGINTRFGKIANTLKSIQALQTPLQLQIKNLALNLAFIALGFSVAIYFVGVSLKFDRLEMFFTAVSSAIAAVPEGLPAIIIITLAVGVKRMALNRAVVRKLVAVEALGSINVICTDKTGTLTRGEMKAARIWINHKVLSVQEFAQIKAHDYAKKFIDSFLIPNTASLAYRIDGGSRAVLGDTTEGALLMLGADLGIDYKLHREQGKIVDEFSFDQKLKSMSAVWEINGQVEALVKAAPEALVELSTRIQLSDQIKLLHEEDKKKLIDAYSSMTKEGLRVLGFGYKNKLPLKSKYTREEVESDLIFLGFIGLADPVRAEAASALAMAKQAGIKTVMITGDNELTAINIAKQLGMAKEGDEVISGRDLEKMSDEELFKIITKVKIFARTSPEHKLRIVQAFQRLGLAVAVTGDGVNDALALKQAEIGIAMGKKGTDVAKEAADMVITDDNYATIVKAVEEGRTIYSNITKSIRYLVSTNVSELLTILISLIIGLPSPLVPAQILWINLVSDGLPAIALSLDPKDPNAMKKFPRQKNHPILNLNSVGALLAIGLVVSSVALIVYSNVLNNTGNLVLARTWAFTILVVLQLLVAFVIRGRSAQSNPKLVSAVLLTLVIQFLILSIPPLYPIFKIQSLW